MKHPFRFNYEEKMQILPLKNCLTPATALSSLASLVPGVISALALASLARPVQGYYPNNLNQDCTVEEVCELNWWGDLVCHLENVCRSCHIEEVCSYANFYGRQICHLERVCY